MPLSLSQRHPQYPYCFHRWHLTSGNQKTVSHQSHRHFSRYLPLYHNPYHHYFPPGTWSKKGAFPMPLSLSQRHPYHPSCFHTWRFSSENQKNLCTPSHGHSLHYLPLYPEQNHYHPPPGTWSKKGSFPMPLSLSQRHPHYPYCFHRWLLTAGNQ